MSIADKLDADLGASHESRNPARLGSARLGYCKRHGLRHRFRTPQEGATLTHVTELPLSFQIFAPLPSPPIRPAFYPLEAFDVV